MRLLIDSCVGRSVVQRIRAEGYDSPWIGDRTRDPGDEAILAEAASERRVLVTIDTDFGTLVFRDNARHAGVLRLKARPPQAMAARALELLAAHRADLEGGAFVTDDGDTVRVTRRP